MRRFLAIPLDADGLTFASRYALYELDQNGGPQLLTSESASKLPLTSSFHCGRYTPEHFHIDEGLRIKTGQENMELLAEALAIHFRQEVNITLLDGGRPRLYRASQPSAAEAA